MSSIFLVHWLTAGREMIASTDGEILMLNKHDRGKRERMADSRRVEKQRRKMEGELGGTRKERCRVCTLCEKTAYRDFYISHKVLIRGIICVRPCNLQLQT